MTAGTGGTAAARDVQAERDYAEWRGWLEAEGYDWDDDSYQAEAFGAGMEAARNLAAATGYGTLAERITRLADAWEHNPHLTEQGQLYRELGQVLRDELHYASDNPQVTR